MNYNNIRIIGNFWHTRALFDTYDEANDANPKTGRVGVRCHDWLTALFLRLLGKIVTIKSSAGKVIYLNKNSFDAWRARHAAIPEKPVPATSETKPARLVTQVKEVSLPSKTMTLKKSSTKPIVRSPLFSDRFTQNSPEIKTILDTAPRQLDESEKRAIFETLPAYAAPFCDDPLLSDACKALFKKLLVETLNPVNLNAVQPLGGLVSAQGEIALALAQFNEAYFRNESEQHLGCRGSAHADDGTDPWQTIKITAPHILEPGKTSALLLELKRGLDKHYHIKSGGGGDWQAWLELPFEAKMKKEKYDPVCFVDSDTSAIMTPQVMLTLIDIKKIIGVIPDDKAYVAALSNAYYKNYNDDPYATPKTVF